MRNLRFEFLAVLLVPIAVGCSSSSASQSTGADASSAIATELEGVYVTNAVGPVTQLEFVDATHVNVSWAACAAGEPCISADTYSMNAAETALTLVEPGGKTSVLTFAALGAAPLGGQSVHDLGVGLSGDASTLTGMDAGALTTGSGKPLVTSFNVKLTTGCVQLFKKSDTLGNDQAAFDFFRSKGLAAIQAAGIVGNLDQESGDSPTSVQPDGPGRGIAQWSAGGRWDTDAKDNLATYAKGQNESVDSLEAQLGFIWYELSTYSKYGLASLKSATTVDQAVQAFSSDFEACGTCEQANRDRFAQTAFNTFASDPVASLDGGGDGGACSGSSAFGTCTTRGGAGTCIDTATCASQGGTATSGLCPGPANIECCTGP